MKVLSNVLGMALAAAVGTVAAQSPAPQKIAETKGTKATFLVTGLHCPPCTKTVESSLGKAKGIRSIKVDWKTKTAHVEFDEQALPAQQLAQLIAATPHMMGDDLHYAGWLVLKVPEIKDEASAKRVQEALSKVEGVDRVSTYPDQHSVGVSFAKKGKLTTADLAAKLKEAGFQAESH